MRNAYIRDQRERHRRLAVAVLPILAPRPLLTAMNVLGVELWGPPGAPRGHDAGRLQAYVCGLVRNALAFVASGGADVADALLVPHTCDSLQGFATLAPDFGGWGKPVLRFQHPKGPARPSATRFVQAELRFLATELVRIGARWPADTQLHEAIALHRRIDALRAELLDQRARVDLDDVALYALLRRGEWLWPEDHLAELEGAKQQHLGDCAVQHGVPLMVTGYVPEPAGLLATLGEAGAYVAGDDWAAVGRRVLRGPAGDVDGPAWERLAAWLQGMPPCPTRTADQPARIAHLWSIFERSGARGLLIHTVKFCEPELFDVPAIRRHFAAHNVPVLHVESELEAVLSGQTTTRLEAFVETLTRRKEAS